MSDYTITVAIGDIHGMHLNLVGLITKISKAYQYVPHQKLKFVFLGDYIDRGPNSCDVINKVMDMKEYFGSENVITLKGNHEEMLLEALHGGKDDASLFLMNGGLATLRSYGVSNIRDIPFKHREFYKSLLTHYEDDLHYFVHAGIAPTIPLSRQSDYDGNFTYSRTWVRDPFLHYTNKHPKYVVHGHTPVREVDIRDNRCNLDTGAVFTPGKLSAALFKPDEEKPFKIIQVETTARSMTV